MGADLLLTYYGDDFTGSTDVMEVLSLGGIRTLLFLDPPSAADLQHFENPQAIGIAGNARAMTPAEMDRTLPDIFRSLHALGGRLIHYKICSTFDSSPEIGSIGQAIDLGQGVLDSPIIPLVVGAPRLGRYCIFGNLFARSGFDSPVYRLDCHPTMRRHPITPMRESDLRTILAEQTARSVVLVDAVTLHGSRHEVGRRLEVVKERTPTGTVVLFDVLYEEHLPLIGEFLWQQTLDRPPLFAIGSAGVECALTAYWQQNGFRDISSSYDAPAPVDQLLVMSGSCSPVTDTQIGVALDHGFTEVSVAPVDLLDPTTGVDAEASVVERALCALRTGRSVIVHTCRGPSDPRLAMTQRWTQERNGGALGAGGALGEALSRILKQILDLRRIPRVVVVGGDTSASTVRGLGIVALEMEAPLAPGAPLCKVRNPGACLDGLQIVLKGGQTGHQDFFTRALHGGVPA